MLLLLLSPLPLLASSTAGSCRRRCGSRSVFQQNDILRRLFPGLGRELHQAVLNTHPYLNFVPIDIGAAKLGQVEENLLIGGWPTALVGRDEPKTCALLDFGYRSSDPLLFIEAGNLVGTERDRNIHLEMCKL